jgi:serine/threonine protein kinase
VVVARERSSDYVVALKRMGRRELAAGNFAEQVRREIVIQSAVSHPHLLKLFGYFWDSQAVYLILEFAPRGELYGLLKEAGCFPEDQVAVVLRQVCAALAHLHARDIIHRDLKPENILVADGQVKIADFGWAVCSPTRRATVCGTLDYLAPEMVKGQVYDAGIDVWGVGILAYELAVGRPPFEETSPTDTYSKIVECEPLFPSHVSAELRSFIRKCLQKHPDRRPPLNFLLQDPFLTRYDSCRLTI